MPLAVTHAATAIVLDGWDYATYREHLAANPLDVGLVREDGSPYPHTVATALVLAIDAVTASLTRDNPAVGAAAGRVLAAMSVLAETGVPRDWLTGLGDPQWAVRRAAGRLIETSLLAASQDGQMVTLHRLTGRVIRETLPEHRSMSKGEGLPLSAQFIGQLVKMLADRVTHGYDKKRPIPERVPVEEALNIVAALDHLDKMLKKEHTDFRTALAPELLQPTVVASLIAGSYLQELGAYEKAITELDRAVKIIDNDTNSSDLSSELHLRLGQNHYRAGHVEQAYECLSLADYYARLNRHQYFREGEIADLEDEIADWESRILVELGHPDDAVEVALNAVDRSPPDSARRANLMGSLGISLWRTGWYEAALNAFDESLKVLRLRESGDSNAVIQALKHKGVILREYGILIEDDCRVRRAREEIDSAIKLANDRPANDPFFELHRLTQERAKTDLVLSHGNGNTALVTELREIHEEHKERHSEDHPNTAGVAIDLSDALLACGETMEAEAIAKEASRAFLTRYNDRHPYLHLPYEVFARVAEARGDKKWALKWLDDCSKILAKPYGENHPYTARVLARRPQLITHEVAARKARLKAERANSSARLRALSSKYDRVASWTEKNRMDAAEFVNLFSGEVRSWFDWDLFQRKCRLALEIVVTREELGELSTVWYRDSSNAFADWRSREARRTTVLEAAADVGFLPAESQKYIEQIREEFNKGDHPRVWGVPVYRTEEDENIIIDGNHRLVALYQSDEDVAVRLILVVASGYDSQFLMPDLIHASKRAIDSQSWRPRIADIERHFSSLERKYQQHKG